MRKYLFAFLVVIAIGSIVKAFPSTTEDLKPTPELSDRAKLIAGLISFNHYSKTSLDDSVSNVCFNNYIEALDNSKLYFLASDFKNFEESRYELDDYIIAGELDIPFQIFNTFKERFLKRIDTVMVMVESDFNFDLDEYYDADRSDAAWAKDNTELNELWRKHLKNQVLNLKISGKERSAINDLLKKRYENYKKTISQYSSEDVFQLFMGAFTEVYDPHTSYLSPISSDNFKIRMSRKLEGIGATLRLENEYTTITRITPGGPAFKSKKLKENDKIVGVAQGSDGEMVDVIGWRLDEVIQLIRGDKGTTVRLSIVPAEAKLGDQPMELALVRDIIKLEEQSATSQIIEYPQDDKVYKIGVISVPSFYMDFDGQMNGDKDYKSTSRDVRKLLIELKEQNVQGVIMDLRNNGGGALLEAIELAGLFIPSGPMVQVKNTDGSIDLGNDPDSTQVYEGSLTVLVNRFSASASEIFAGAIQDYKRGVVVGEQTYGKGTVQNIVNLSRFLPNAESDKQGQLNLTLAKYYRVSGSSTQHLGVLPDIVFPSPYDADIYGESAQPSALPWDEINPAAYQILSNVDGKILDKLYQNYSKRLQEDKDLKELIEEIEKRKQEKDEDLISLNEAKKRKERELQKAGEEKENSDNLSGQKIESSETGDKLPSILIEDIYLRNGVQILADLIIANIG